LRNSILALGVLGFSASVRAQEAAPVTLDSLMASMASIDGLEAHFREEKHIALLAAPLVNEGTIHFVPPARLLRQTERPSRSMVRIERDRLFASDAESESQLDLSEAPAVRVFVQSFLWLLSGNRAELERAYDLRFEAEGQRWQLVLRPRAAPLTRMIREIRASGTGIVLHRLVVLETSGDSSNTEFSAVNTNRRHTPSELQRLFGAASAPRQ